MNRKITRLAIFLLAFMMIVSFAEVPVLAATQRFRDVSQSKWYYDYVENLASKRIINGYPNGDFRPDNRVERQHVCVMVAKAAGLSSQGKRANFSDVPRNSETSPFIATLQEKGAVGGYPDGTFRPKRSVTRAEIAAIIAQGFDIKSAGTVGGLKDIVGHWGEGMIRRLASNGIIKGYPDGTYRPNAPVTRAELSKIITVAMAVAAIQKVEAKLTTGNYAKAQQLVDALPSYQDREAKQELQNRLNRVKIIVTLPSFPAEYSEIGSYGTIYTKMKISQMNYVVTDRYVEFTYVGQKTYEQPSGLLNYVGFRYKLVGDDGIVVATGTSLKSGLHVGDRFNGDFTIYGVNPGYYTLELYDDD